MWPFIFFFGGGWLGPHLTQCGRCQGLPPCQVSSWSIQPFGHNTPTLQTDRQDRTGQRTVWQTVAPKRRSFFTEWIVNVWNSLPANVDFSSRHWPGSRNLSHKSTSRNTWSVNPITKSYVISIIFYFLCVRAPRWPGAPLFPHFPPFSALSIHFLIFCSFYFSPFPFLILFTYLLSCPSLPLFYKSSPTPFPGRRS